MVTPSDRQVVTLRMVAAEAKVSTAAVSQALNHKGTLSDETRQRIQTIADQMGYRRNLQAASLRRGITHTIGYVAYRDPDPASAKYWAHHYGSHVLTLTDAAAELGYTVTVIPDTNPELIESSRVDGIFYLDPSPGSELLERAVELGLPIASNIGLPEIERKVFIDNKYAESTLFALDALAASGARRIALVTEPPGYESDDVAEAAYREWCKRNHREPNVMHGNWGRTDIDDVCHKLFESGADGAYSFYEEGPKIQANCRAHHGTDELPNLIAAAGADPHINLELGIPTIFLNPLDLAARALTALVDVIEQRSEVVTVSSNWQALGFPQSASS